MNRSSFSIITPSYRNSEWLKLCIASVHDQAMVLEHIVQDAGSDDGTLDWLPSDSRVRTFVEKDAGMYDGVNRGLRRATGDYLAYLNCDEQYLPGALEKVHDFFEANPEVDVVFGDVVIVESSGEFRCFRKVNLPWYYYTKVCSNLCTFTAGTFMRRSVLDQHQLYFDPTYRALGDADWMLRALRVPLRMAVLGAYTSTFTETGQNLGQLPVSAKETQALIASAPLWARRAAPVFKMGHRLRRIIQGSYSQKPFEYSIHTQQTGDQRIPFSVTKPTARWVR